MQKATPAGTGAMAALLGAELDQAREICAASAEDPETGRREVVEVANDNGGGQIVVSGHVAAVDRAIEKAKEAGVKRAMKLPVSAPFHCALMAPAADAMAEALEDATMHIPAVAVVANVSAAKATDPAEIRELLVQQVTGTVRWRECVLAMATMGCDRFVEIGSGKVLTGLMKRIAPEATAGAVGTPADVEAFLKSL
jgi:[acyl-carrier-protein] S-malonyltransferase